MAGRGPMAKPATLRARRNKASTRLDAVPPAGTPPAPTAPPRVPRLPVRGCGACRDKEAPIAAPKRRRKKGKGRKKAPAEPVLPVCTICAGSGIVPYHPRTLERWGRLWSDPSAERKYPGALLDELFDLATLWDRIHWGGASPDLEDLRESRLRAARFGLDPGAMRGLQWELPDAPPAESERQSAAPSEPSAARPDPRVLLFSEGGGRA